MPSFHGEPTRVLENQFVRLEYLANSARIVRFSPQNKANLFADLGMSPVETPYGSFYFHGGHRLWHSPEAMPRTYIPDNDGAEVCEIPDGERIEMPTEVWTNITKTIQIRLNPERAQVILQHELRNDGAWPVEFAAWGLTMFRLGGIGIFPQPAGYLDEAGLLPNRRLVFWPYARMDDPRLILRDDFILVRASPGQPPLKFGYFNPHAWMAYWLDGVLFVKRFDSRADASFPDYGCNTESYCNDQFIELESLGPLGKVVPGQTIMHIEFWEVYEQLDVAFMPEEIQKQIADCLGGR